MNDLKTLLSGCEIALQAELADGFEVPEGVSRVCFGERFCVRRFLGQADRLPEFAARVRAAGARAVLSIPSFPRESEIDRVVEVVEKNISGLDGLLCGEPGLLGLFRDRLPLTYSGPHYDPATRRLLADKLSLERLRPMPPFLSFFNGQSDIALELVVSGHLPLGATPRCHIRIFDGCQACDTPLRIENRAGPVYVSGNHYRSICRTEFYAGLPLLAQLPAVKSLVIETWNLTAQQVTEAVAVYSGEKSYTSSGEKICNGFYLNRYGSETESERFTRYFPDIEKRVLRQWREERG